jgi:hypothetical protein
LLQLLFMSSPFWFLGTALLHHRGTKALPLFSGFLRPLPSVWESKWFSNQLSLHPHGDSSCFLAS